MPRQSSNSSTGLSWQHFWIKWNDSTLKDKQWMMKDGGLYNTLEDVVKSSPLDVKNEIFEYAPEDICKWFKFTPQVSASEPANKKQKYTAAQLKAIESLRRARI